ncbi:TetR/AcrR family transcriptional regulator [Modestobacter sp. SSW1-42]|uniref:TetR/AcrR family transcriptional regulator n=1 Tax=Modestobacter sp. SSW1-42 TaxID=596372 RepID=UPI003988838B
MENTNAYVREPKQERSRLSFDRAVDAAVSLLVERRAATFTLAEVAERAGVSTGSIYGRVDSKDDLLRTAHAREMTRMSVEQTEALTADAPEGETFPETVSRLVHTAGDLLRRNAGVLAPFMVMGPHDPVIAELGQRSYREFSDAFSAALLARDEITHPEPARAAAWSCTVVYSVLARWLGLGSAPDAAGEGDWDVILDDLAEMVTAFLTGAPRG